MKNCNLGYCWSVVNSQITMEEKDNKVNQPSEEVHSRVEKERKMVEKEK